MSPLKVDVLISGAGPVGLLLAYQFLRQGLSVHIVDQDDKTAPGHPRYGRASTLLPRTLELLDGLDLFDALAQLGVVADRSVTYDAAGARVYGRGWDYQVGPADSFFDLCLNLRLKFSEDVFRSGIEGLGGRVEAPVRLVNFTVEPVAAVAAEEEKFPVLATCEGPGGVAYPVHARFLIGADGGHSSVRKLAGIQLQGSSSTEHWVRIDAEVRTDMPDARVGFAAVESRTHGQVLWVALDHGATRIGFALSEEQVARMGPKLTEEQVIAEAKLAMAPFKLDFVRVDWHTTYSISQRVAESLRDGTGRVFLAGDAAHTHSSGAAQGMNTGVHDAVTLAWRITGVLQGRFKPEVLDSYSPERHATAKRLIDFDKQLSALQSGHDVTSTGAGQDAGDVVGDVWSRLDHLMRQYKEFSTGLGISYEANLLNAAEPPLHIAVQPGHRAPDVTVHKPGSRLATRLLELMKIDGRFKVVVFAGVASEKKWQLRKLAEEHGILESNRGYDLVTVVAGHGTSPHEHMGFKTFGNTVWDRDSSAHRRYGASTESGAIVVVRPDGIVGTTAPLGGFEHIHRYFANILAA